MYYKTNYQSPIGLLTLASNENNQLVGLWIEGQKYFGESIRNQMVFQDNLAIFTQVKEWLDRYFKGEQLNIKELALAPIGSEFRQNVWQILMDIPYGKVMTYGDIAKEIAKKRQLEAMSAQAVGGAVGHNPISIIIPCHRVIGSNGSLTGFANGISTKISLLELERVDIQKFIWPSSGTAL